MVNYRDGWVTTPLKKVVSRIKQIKFGIYMKWSAIMDDVPS